MPDDVKKRITMAEIQGLREHLETLERALLGEVDVPTHPGKRPRTETEERRRAWEYSVTLLNATTESAFLMDPDGHLLAANAIGAARLGRTADEVRGMNLRELVAWELFERRMERIQDVCCAQQPLRFEEERDQMHFDTLLTPVFGADGQVSAVAEFAQDITELRRLGETLDQEASLNAAMAALSHELLQAEDIQGLCLAVLAHAKRLTGSPHGLVGWIDPDTGGLMRPADPPASGQAQAVDGLHGLWGWVLDNRQPLLSNDPASDPRHQGAPPGHPEPVRFLAAPALHGETAVGLISLADSHREYTDRDLVALERVASVLALGIRRRQAVEALRRSEGALRRAKEEAETASRLKSEFLANMSHEIRTPIGNIMGIAEMTLASDLTPRQAAHLEMIQDSARSLLGIVNDVLDFSRIEAGKLTVEAAPFELAPTMERALAPVAFHCRRKGLAFAMEVDRRLPKRLVGDSGRLAQVLVNLASNACKFTDEGRVDVEAATVGEPEQGGVHVRFTVTDTGIGIPASEHPKLFKSFSQVDGSLPRQHRGAGLGLAICRDLVELMGGSIRLESEPGMGSSFFFTVPLGLADEETGPCPGQAQPAPSRERTPLSVLLAEDNSMSRTYLTSFLEEGGHRAACAGDGDKVLAMLRAERFDVVVMDVQMPGMDGLEATRRIRAGEAAPCPADIPILALTAHAVKGDRERMLAAGMDDYLAKPVTQDGLLAALDRLADRRPPCSRRPSSRLSAGEDGGAMSPEALLERFRGKERLLGRMLDLYRSDVPAKREGLDQALEQGRWDDAADLLHSLANSTSTLGAVRASGRALSMEKELRAGRAGQAMAMAEGLARDLDSVGRAAAALRDSLPPTD